MIKPPPVTEADWQSWFAQQKRQYVFAAAVDPSDTYKAAHQRVMRERGAAAAHQCAGIAGRPCQRQAVEWSYDHNDPDQLTTELGTHYSLRAAYYSPRCKPCHAATDRAPGDRPSKHPQRAG